jgi:gamma-resorcylate decarboxylase
MEALDVPFYLHPRNPLPQDARIYDGHPWLIGPKWAFGQETAVHALRLMGCGLFDEHPKLQIVIGHMGEGLPFSMWRVDHHNLWVKNLSKQPAKRKFADYFQENFHITVSGNFSTPALLATMMVVGADRIMFSTDWPFENIDHAANWFDATPISEADRAKIGRTNAVDLFKLGKVFGATQPTHPPEVS